MNEQSGPPKITFPGFLLRILATGTGSSIGAIVLLLIFVLASSLLTPLVNAQAGDYVSPIFIFITIIMVFASTTIGNILSTLFLALTDRNRYKRKSSTIYQIFIVSILMFILMAPVYFLTASIDVSLVAYAIALHIIITAQVSILILEIVSNYRYSLVGLYGVAFSIILSAIVLFGLANILPDARILLLVALPVVWISIGIMHSLVTMIYGAIVSTYDKDFLSTQTLYGGDYGEDVEGAQEQEKRPRVKDQAGASFLRKKR